jgi:hypothetical protein
LILSVSAGELSEPTQNKEEEFAHA